MLLLSVKGEVMSMGENFENQLGSSSDDVPHRPKLEKVPGIPPIQKIYVGRNHCFAIGGDNELIGWGSNRYGQISPSEDLPMIVKPQKIKMSIPEGRFILSSYFTLFLTPEKSGPKLEN